MNTADPLIRCLFQGSEIISQGFGKQYKLILNPTEFDVTIGFKYNSLF